MTSVGRLIAPKASKKGVVMKNLIKRQSSFTESLLCRYMVDRAKQNKLWLDQVVRNGRPIMAVKKKRVKKNLEYLDTRFPDFTSIQFQGSSKSRPAEVKYLTSLFNYHVNSPVKFKNFMTKHGCIISLKHDALPDGLNASGIDVYQVNQEDYRSYIMENTDRLLDQQIEAARSLDALICYTGLKSNFFVGSKKIKPGKESGIYSLKENMASQLTSGTRILFPRIGGIDRKGVEKKQTLFNWRLEELTIAEVTNAESREKYCLRKGLCKIKKLWANDPKKANKWHWSTVIEFKTLGSIKAPIEAKDLKACTPFLKAIQRSFKDTRPTVLKKDHYIAAMEVLATI